MASRPGKLNAETPEQIGQFHQIYVHTMDRNQAQAKYYYPLQFFMDFYERMSGNARFALAEHNGKIIAGTLFLHDGHDVYSYLGGAYDADQGVRPANALVYETICWARDQIRVDRRNPRSMVFPRGDGGEHEWCPEKESNLRLILRRDLFYPLNYRGASMAPWA